MSLRIKIYKPLEISFGEILSGFAVGLLIGVPMKQAHRISKRRGVL